MTTSAVLIAIQLNILNQKPFKPPALSLIMKPKQIQDLKKAGNIAKQVREYAKSIAKKDMPLLELAEKIEAKIIELGGKPAFPTNLSINEIAAHFTPSYNDEEKARGLLKIDFGVQVNGFTADTAFSVDLENSEVNKKLIQTAEDCLANAIKAVKDKKTLAEIGKEVQQTAEKSGFSPIQNLSGHEIAQYDLHAGITIPNYDNGNKNTLDKGIYAIEPFTTTGQGKIYEGKPSGIYKISSSQNVRDNNAREILSYIAEEYMTLPFCSRWLVKKFGTRALISLRFLENAGVIHQYPQLIEISKMPVAQAEHTLLIDKDIEVISE